LVPVCVEIAFQFRGRYGYDQEADGITLLKLATVLDIFTKYIVHLNCLRWKFPPGRLAKRISNGCQSDLRQTLPVYMLSNGLGRSHAAEIWYFRTPGPPHNCVHAYSVVVHLRRSPILCVVWRLFCCLQILPTDVMTKTACGYLGRW